MAVRSQLKQASLGALRQVAILAIALGAALFLMPCSPFSLWGAAYCPTTPAAIPAAAPGAGLDFARDVVAASAGVPVLVDFHASWCGPCKLMGPEIEALAAERGARLRVVKIDVDQHPALAQEHGVNSIPDVRLWIGGKEAARFSGYRAKAGISAWIDQATAGAR